MPKKNQRIFITGGTGFLGNNIVKTLLEKKFSINNLTNNTSNNNQYNNSLYNECTATDVINGINENIVIHCATSYGRNNESFEEIFEPNVNLPLRLLLQMIDSGKESFFINIDTSLPSSTSTYALSKKIFLSMAKKIILGNSLENLKFINISLEHFYGPNGPENNFITFLINSMLSNSPEIKLTQGNQERDFIFIQDAVDAIMVIIDKRNSLSGSIHSFEIGSGHNIKLKDAVLEIAKTLSFDQDKLNFGAIPYRDNEEMISKVNLQKIKGLGWKAKFSFSQGILKTLNIK